MQENKVAEIMHTKGQQLAEIFDMRCKQAMAIELEIQNFLKSPTRFQHRDYYQQMLAELRRLFKVREYAVNNIIVTAGRAVEAQRLANITTYTGIINYGLLGSGSTTPSNANTQLATEVFRKVVASASATSNVSFIDFFYSKADTNGTYNEFGTVIDGTGSANTGQLYTRALTGGWVKSSSESMTVACQYTKS